MENNLVMELNYKDMEIRKLKATIYQQEKTIKQLRQTLAQLGVDPVVEIEATGYTKPQRGRPRTIDEETCQRIVALKAKGLSVRAIALQEGVSVGTVSKILHAK